LENLSVPRVFSVVKNQKNFGITPKSEAQHLKKEPEGSAEAAQIKVKEY
jgi:hypothetical protein